MKSNALPVRDNVNCWHCNTKLIWSGDHDIEEDNEAYLIETNLTCPQCRAEVYVYLPKEEK
jgi:hypothetical protein